jgi:hypothetical protein
MANSLVFARHTKVVDTWLDGIIETCDRKMSSELQKVAKRLRWIKTSMVNLANA